MSTADSLFFDYSDVEIQYLKKKDKKLSRAIDIIGLINRPVNPDLFSSLVNVIIGQQISTKAQMTVFQRLLDKTGSIVPKNIYNLRIEDIQQCGMTNRKALYIKELAELVVNEEIDLEMLKHFNDTDICKTLCGINGIGLWTAEMLMIFSMQRPNIFSYGDLAIHRGMQILYGHKKIDKVLFAKYHNRYSPYASVASLYLWEIASGKYQL